MKKKSVQSLQYSLLRASRQTMFYFFRQVLKTFHNKSSWWEEIDTAKWAEFVQECDAATESLLRRVTRTCSLFLRAGKSRSGLDERSSSVIPGGRLLLPPRESGDGRASACYGTQVIMPADECWFFHNQKLSISSTPPSITA